ncbi:host specificity factor TipJ family phage tail protein [uncultured Pseudacidovorax sp.]|uniref:host specificity factor TipJ family phage tail protein n=1 Tax=uncultured Pseudacidovorax sp. TaxID=679313 RepID=UPI0025D6B309|nr:host specificity factor TipJ family phage tail protein [uncultured Pseudacidovorax sp.]
MSTTIRLYEHPFAAGAPRVVRAASLAEWLLDHYGARPSCALQIYAGEPSADTRVEQTVEAIMAAAADEYTVLQSPGADGGASFFIAFVLSVASAALAPDPQMPANVNRTQESPNNALGARDNQVRLLQRIEDIYGTVRSIPTQIMATYTKYIGNEQVEFGYYCIGRGYYDVSDLRDADTLLSYIRGAGARVYPPFTSPNSGSPQLSIGEPITDPVLTVRRSQEIDGVTLMAANQLQLAPNALYLLAKAGPARTVSSGIAGGSYAVPASSYDQILQLQPHPNIGSISEVGQTVDISGVPNDPIVTDRTVSVWVDGPARTYKINEFVGGEVVPGDTMTFTGFAAAENNGTFTVQSASGQDVTFVEGGQLSTAFYEYGIDVHIVHPIPSFNGTRTIRTVADQRLELTTAVWAVDRLYESSSPVTIVVNNGLTDWTDWITLPATDRNRVWCNFMCAQGLYAENGGKFTATVGYEVQVERLDGALNPTGQVEGFSSAMSASSTAQQAETVEHYTAWTGPARVRARRTTPFLYAWQGTVVDEVKWVDLFSVSPVDKAHFGALTTVHTMTQATTRATAVRNRQLNALVTRRIPTWTGSGFSGGFDGEGRHVWGDLHGTAYLRDVLAAVSLDPVIGRRTLAELDMVQIDATAAQVYAMHPQAAAFNYTLDADTLSYEETVNMIAEACFCKAYRQSGRLRLAFERAQAAPTAMFCHRNKEPDAETITRTFANDADYDGIELVYQDPDTERAETIRLPAGGDYTKLKKIERPGIRFFAQAWLHANREYRKLLGQRMTIETSVTGDGRALVPMSRIDVVDNTVFQAYDGEVMAQAGLVLTLSRPVVFEAGEQHSILLQRRDGSVQSIMVEPGPTARQVVLQSVPDEALVTTPTPEDGIRTSFSFASNSMRLAQAWLLQEMDLRDEPYVKLVGVNYSDDYYAMDTQPIPNKEAVIN